MAKSTDGAPRPRDEERDAGRSVLEILGERTGEAPKVTLREEDSAAVSAPLIDPSTSEKASLPQGRGTYQLMGEIARGGMGVVLKGHDTDLGRDVALKVLDKRLAERPDVVQRFVEEAQIGGQLQHPGIVPVYELGLMADERPYFTMKLVKGRTLATLLTERESPDKGRRRLIDVFESVCQTMAYAHSRGVIHRDLKPANIMVGAFGEVQVVDWGLAKVLARGGTADERRAREAHSNLTVLETVRSDGSSTGTESMVGSILGTPAYMPPEQASGLVDRLDERADVFALGAILCEILTGRPPYVGERDEVIAAAAQAEQSPALERLDACGADPELVKLAKQCLLAAPAARPANAGAVAERVHEYSVTVEERAHSAQVEAAEARVRVAEERKARRLTLALGGSVAAILLVLIGGWSYLERERANQERVEAARLADEALRRSELAGEVGVLVAEAEKLELGESWEEGLLVAERARALAEGGDADGALLARVDGVLERLRGGQEAKQARVEVERETQRLLADLAEEREPGWDSVVHSGFELAKREAERLEQTFLDYGIDLFAGTPQEAAQVLTERGLGADVALVLDDWIQSLQDIHQGERADRLLSIAHLVDADPLRADLRSALANRELEVLRWIADQGFELQPPGTIELLATALARLGDKDLSRQVLRAGCDLYAQDFGLQYRLGRSLVPFGVEKGDPRDLAEGIGCLTAALGQRPGSEPVRFQLGRLYDKMELHELALEQFQALVDAGSTDDRVAFHRGRELFHVRQFERAIEVFERLVEEARLTWVRIWSAATMGECYLALGEGARGAELLEWAIVEPGANNSEWQNVLIDYYLTGGEDLETSVSRVEALFPDRAEIQNNLAWSLLVERPNPKSHELAHRLATHVVELEQRGVYFNTLGVAQLRVGDYEGALDSFETSMDLDGWSVYDAFMAAVAKAKMGRTEEARADYDRAVTHHRANPTLDSDVLWMREEARREFGY